EIDDLPAAGRAAGLPRRRGLDVGADRLHRALQERIHLPQGVPADDTVPIGGREALLLESEDGVESLVAVNTIRFAPGERCATAAQEAENVEPVLDCSDSPVVRLAPADRRGVVRGPFQPRIARKRGR